MTTQETDQLAALERRKWDLWIERNVDALGRLYADDFVEVDVSGRGVVTKAQMLAEMQAGALVILHAALEDMRVLRPGAETAIVVYRTTGRFSAFGQEGEAVAYASSTLVKRGGEWQTVSYQATPAVASTL